MASVGDLEEVCNFLRARGVAQDVIDNFEYEKMDVQAIAHASDNDLLLLGLEKRGDVLSLRNFVEKFSKESMKDERRSEKMSLLQDFLKNGKGQKSLKSVNATNGTKRSFKQAKENHVGKMRKVHLGWLHYDEEKQKFVSVRAAKGGGTREVDIELTARKDHVIDIAKTIFFSDDHSIFGYAHCMTFGLANFYQKDITMLKFGGADLAFTLQRYIDKCKMSRVRLYLTSKITNPDESSLIIPVDQKPGSSKSKTKDSDLLTSRISIPDESSLIIPVDQKRGSSKPKTKDSDSNSDSTKSQLQSQLEEKRNIIAEQDAAYEQSLAADKAKRQKLSQEIQDAERQCKLQQARLLRTPQEPESACIAIQVRHLSLGIVRRNFHESQCMACVYDWVGSLSLTPEHFQLLDYAGKMLLPSQPLQQAQNTTLYMTEVNLTPALDDGEVTFLGFGSGNEWEPLADADYTPQPINETPPHQLLELDECSDSDISEIEQEHDHAQQQPRKRKIERGRRGSADSRGRRFRQQYLPMLTAQQSPTPFGDNKASSQPSPTENDNCSANESEMDQEWANESRNDQGSTNGGGHDQDAVYSPGANEDGGNEQEAAGSTESNEGSVSGSGNDQGSGDGDSDDGGNDQNSPDSFVRDWRSPNKKKRTLRIRRELVLQDLIQVFSNEEIMTCDITVVMVDSHGNDETGEDVRGIYRDALACFWQQFYIFCTLGERERVPALRHDFQCDEWTAVGRIIAKGYSDLGYFPVMLSPAFIISVVFGEKEVCEETLLHSFNRYLAPDDEDVVREALQCREDKDASEDEELIDLLDRYGCRKLPTQENVKDLILELAHKELVQKPQYVADCWSAVLSKYLKGSDLSTPEKVHDRYKALEPTTRKVLGMIQAEPCSNSERSALDYLKRFIRGMDLTQLKSFLMFVTGSDVTCVTTIYVEFTKLDGLGRRPIAHTCGCFLELPSTYEEYTEFRAEFSNVLAKEKWQNDIM